MAQSTPSLKVKSVTSDSLEVNSITTDSLEVKSATIDRQVLTDAANIDWDIDSGANADVTIVASRVINAPTNLQDSSTLVLKVIQGGTGNNLLTWNSIFKWAAGAPPVLSNNVGEYDLIFFYFDGTYMNGSFLRNMS